ncbi:MAG: ATPase [Verrucomicrobiota bacterium]|nr:ATPase [Verrucomicrobiota bacterium]
MVAPGPPRTDRLLHEHIHDTYKLRHKFPEPTVCPVCNAVFQNGRWRWAESWPIEAHREMCEACRRIKDQYPAGQVTLKGGAIKGRKTEILNLVRNLEKLESAEHPLHRIMKIEERPHRVVISTTDLHLARRIGEAVCHAHKGRLDWDYNKEACYVRVNWTSDY